MMMDQKEFHSYDIRIASNGDWYHEGSKIKRFELVKLFASALHYKEDKKYWLITPKEEGVIKVDDAPFIIKEINYKGNDEFNYYQICPFSNREFAFRRPKNSINKFFSYYSSEEKKLQFKISLKN